MHSPSSIGEVGSHDAIGGVGCDNPSHRGLTPGLLRSVRQTTALVGKLYAEHGYGPSLEELGHELNITEAGVRRFLRVARSLGLIRHTGAAQRPWVPVDAPDPCPACAMLAGEGKAS